MSKKEKEQKLEPQTEASENPEQAVQAEAEQPVDEPTSTEGETETAEPAQEAAKPQPEAKAEAELKEKMLRLQADFENYKRRSQKEKTDIYNRAVEGLLTRLLPVIDNLERAEAAATDNLDSYREGVDMIFKSLLNVLNTEGLKEIEALGSPFDPNFHHGVAVGEDPELDDQVIMEVFQKGYCFKDKVIRPAMVKVNQK